MSSTTTTKRVRFSDATTTYPFAPSVPTPPRSAWSIPSLAWSPHYHFPNVGTAYPYVRTGAPSYWSTPSMTCSPLSSSSDGSLFSPLHTQVCPLLAFSAVPGITFDASKQPLESLTVHNMPLGAVLQDMSLSGPATIPPTQSLILLSDLLPWYIKVYPASSITMSHCTAGASRLFVTQADLISCVFNTLQCSVTAAEFSSFSLRMQAKVSEQFYRRMGRSKDAREMNEVKKHGVMRIDVLLGKTTFVGLGVINGDPRGTPSLSLYFR